MTSFCSLTLFPDLNDPVSAAEPSVPTPTLPNLHMMSIEQIMAAQSDIEANHFTLTSCVETVTAVTKLAHRLQNRTSELHQLNAQHAILQCMYKDARAEIGALKAENKECKRKITSMARFGATSFLVFDSRRGVLALNESTGQGRQALPKVIKRRRERWKRRVSLAAIGSAFVGSPSHGSWAVVLGVVGGALSSIVNTLEHGGQIGMVFEMYRSNAGFFKLMEESIESNLKDREVERRENGELFEMKVALQLGRSLSELKDFAASSSVKGEAMEEFASKLF
ncbi:unnamed protein product [Camellia sinensis]